MYIYASSDIGIGTSLLVSNSYLFAHPAVMEQHYCSFRVVFVVTNVRMLLARL